MNKEQYNLEQKLQAIWRLGDQDEMSIKHVGHGVAALITYGDYRRAADYRFPKCYSDLTQAQEERALDNLDKRLEPRWSKISALLGKWGKDKFLEDLQHTSFGFYALIYLDSSWLYPQEEN